MNKPQNPYTDHLQRVKAYGFKEFEHILCPNSWLIAKLCRWRASLRSQEKHENKKERWEKHPKWRCQWRYTTGEITCNVNPGKLQTKAKAKNSFRKNKIITQSFYKLLSIKNYDIYKGIRKYNPHSGKKKVSRGLDVGFIRQNFNGASTNVFKGLRKIWWQ